MAAVFAAAFWAPAHAGEVNVAKGSAIQGYDPVAYFTDGKPVRGKADYAATYKGAEYRFASAKNRDAFAASPETYAPEYGGWCAYGMSKGYKAPIDPAAFTIIKNKLYLNYSKSVQSEWRKDVPGYVAKGRCQLADRQGAVGFVIRSGGLSTAQPPERSFLNQSTA